MGMEKKISTSDQIRAKWDMFHERIASEAKELAQGQANMTESAPCKFCQGTSIKILFSKRNFQYGQCQDCGLIFIYPQLSSDFLARVYNDSHVRDFYFEEILLDFNETHQIPIFEKRLGQIRFHLDRTCSGRLLLDVGCAAGNFITLAQAQGWQTVGLELNQTYVNYAQQERHLDVRNCSVDDFVGQGELFDVVTMWDVPEHLYDPIGTLKQVGKLVNPGGILATTTISHNCINARLLGKDWRYYSPPDHVYSFTPKLIEQILEIAGFEVCQIKHHYLWDIFVEGLRIKGCGDIDIRFRISDRLEYLLEQKGMWVQVERYTLMAVELTLSTIVKGIKKLAESLKSGDIIEIYARKV
jgi:SAM-dependent methyltransferase